MNQVQVVWLSFFIVISGGCRENHIINGQEKMAPDDKAWRIIGPGAGGGVFIPTISPFDTNLIFSKGDMTGSFVSYNGGISWNVFNLAAVTEDFEFDPFDQNTIYASSRGYLYDEDRGSGLSMLYRSRNRGKSWEILYPDVNKIPDQEIIQSKSFLPSQLADNLPDGSIDIISIDNSDNQRIYLGLSPLRPYIGQLPSISKRESWIMASENGGNDWQEIARIPGSKILGIVPNCETDEGNDIFVITDEKCVTINCNTGNASTVSYPGNKITNAGYGIVAGKPTIYLVIEDQNDLIVTHVSKVFRSDDIGENWVDVSKDLLPNIPEGSSFIINAISICKTNPDDSYLSLTSLPQDRKDAGNRVRYEIYRSSNSGENWTKVYSANAKEVLTNNFNDSWLNTNYGPGWGGDILTLGVAPTDPDICYATDFGQMYKTSNGGRTWSQVCSNNNPDGSVSSRGLDLTCCYGVIFDPFDKEHIIVSYIDIGLFHSFDGGKSWKQLINGIPDNWVNTCYHVTFDPSVKGRVWSTWADKHSLPRKSQFGDGLFSGYHGGVAYSEDGGRTWEKSNTGLPENSVCTDLLLDTLSPENSRTLYLCTFNQGVFKSIDGGKSWTGTNRGLKTNRYAWEIRLAGKKIYLLCVRGWREEQSIDGVLYYSEDSAETWHEANLPEGVTAPSDLLISHEDPSHMYLSCWPKPGKEGDICGGVFETTDGGNSWKQCFNEKIRVFAAAFDPENSGTIYINTFQNAAYRSDDSGKNWNKIKGYRFKWGHCPIPDPYHPGMLYLTTYGVSVYYGPGNSTAEEFGNIENLPDSWE